jgi:hypothetical protein
MRFAFAYRKGATMNRDGKGASGRMNGKRRLAGLGLAASLLASPALAAAMGETGTSLGVGATVVQACRVGTGAVGAGVSARLACSPGTHRPEITSSATPVDRARPVPAPPGLIRFVTITH